MMIFSKEAFSHALLDPAYDVKMLHCRMLSQPVGWVGIPDRLTDHLLIMVESGVMGIRIDGVEGCLRAGEVCWLCPGTERLIWVDADSRRVRNWRLRFSLKRKAQDVICKGGPFFCREAEALLSYFSLLAETCTDMRLHAELRPLLAACAHRFFSLSASHADGARRLTAMQRQRVDQLVVQNMSAGAGALHPAEMAEAAGLSPDYFTRIFRNTYGMSPRRYLLETRMRYAGDLLTSGMYRIKEVCALLGEGDEGTFCRLFKKVMGCTPTQYRIRNS